ncbi:MAG: hypothetical protein COU06_01660 [Candidatus Harrisonbacteria bacterium CG10_big_fil_rev_8_21_14_0_10_38_8]|uniref:O-antigen ligase-related domain-containing protein n=1 Tax=Candidatus Harrisonbacteria bacterium CG10_big_fil_rev_8_21_14_0_10_38_8 TaxID=1974582 RepID=A0A2M6WJX7_9BACT|nr:MAG: hypothetical protein COU06_01660 [Candidatus Harrisonbacteria bacterium CG10_big_fil_rev_8_21_14_0_10_38_8]
MFSKENLTKAIITGLYLAPLTLLIYYKKSIYPFQSFKTAILLILIELMVITFSIYLVRNKEHNFQFSRLARYLGIFLLVLTIASILGENLPQSLWSIQARAFGLVAMYHLYALLILFENFKERLDLKKYLSYIYWLGVLLSLIAIIQKINPMIFFEAVIGRPGGTLGNPTYLAALLLFILGYGFYQLREKLQEKKPYLVHSLSLIIPIYAFILTNTRGAILGLVAGVFIALVYTVVTKSKGVKITKNIPAVILIILLIFTSIFITTRSSSIWSSVPGLNRLASISLEDKSTRNRLISWEIAYESFKENPILGIGVDNFSYPFDSNYRPELLDSNFTETFFDKPHNHILEIMVTSGVLGILSYLLLIGYLFYLIHKNTPERFKVFGIAILSAYLVQNLFLFDTISSFLMLIIFMAYISSFTEAQKDIRIRFTGFFFTALALLLIFINIQVVRANRYQYNGLNLYSQQYIEEGTASYLAGLKISQPYSNDYRYDFVASLKQLIRQIEFTDEVTIDLALEKYGQVLEKDPASYRHLANLAEAKASFAGLNPKYTEGFEADIENLQKLSPDRQQTLFIHGQYLSRLGRYEEAFEVFEEAVNLDNSVGTPHFFYALVLAEAGELERAEVELALAKELGRDVNTATEAMLIGSFYLNDEQLTKAYDYYTQAYTLEPLNPDVLLKLGALSYDLNKRGEAKELFTKLLEVAPEFTQTSVYRTILPALNELGVR